MKYWDYEDYNGSLEDAIQRLMEKGRVIQSITILKYASNNINKQQVLFPVRALILYN
jgi:hypothetical protein